MAVKPHTDDPHPPARRRGSRFRVQAPLDVTVLRSGIPDTVPGRSLNVGEGGLAAILAGELQQGEPVAVEIHLPQAANPLRTRALVRHHDQLRCGMEFVGLTPQQQAAIRDWTIEAKAEPDADVNALPPAPSGKGSESAGSFPAGSGAAPSGSPRLGGRGWIFLLASLTILLGVLCWHWYRGWDDLEAGLRQNRSVARPEAHVPADVMEKLVTHRVDPDYPVAARSGRLQGIIVLDVTVGSDGSVLDVRALNGPDILAQSATEAMRWWRFQPYKVDGKAVVTETTVAMEFRP
jgi:TonB family protein